MRLCDASNRASAVQPAFGLKVDLMGLFWRIVGAKAYLLSVYSDLCQPSLFVRRDAKETAEVAFFGFADVLLVAHVRNIAQVCKAVIQRIAVDVVNLVKRHFARDVQPSKPVRSHVHAINTNEPSPALHPSSRLVCSLSAASGVPCKNTRLWVVVKKFAQAFCGKIAGTHAVAPVKQWFVERPVSVSALCGLRYFSMGVK